MAKSRSTRATTRTASKVVVEPQELMPKTKNQGLFMNAIDKNDLVICDAMAGTGKTTIAVGMACRYLLRGKVEKIILCRPLAQCGPGVGFLPGDINNKALPFMHPMMDALDIFLGDSVKKNIDLKKIVITPLETLRGGNLHNCFIILDEMQNAEYSQLKMLGTRIGDNSKAVFVGDMSQSDVNKHYFNNTKDIQEKFFDNIMGEDGVAFVRLTSDDVVRSKMAKMIATKCP
jgi:phosphate starvation-inducible PhoH-like protein